MLKEISFCYNLCILRCLCSGSWEELERAASAYLLRGGRITIAQQWMMGSLTPCHCGTGSSLHSAPLCLGIVAVPTMLPAAPQGWSNQWLLQRCCTGSLPARSSLAVLLLGLTVEASACVC